MIDEIWQPCSHTMTWHGYDTNDLYDWSFERKLSALRNCLNILWYFIIMPMTPYTMLSVSRLNVLWFLWQCLWHSTRRCLLHNSNIFGFLPFLFCFHFNLYARFVCYGLLPYVMHIATWVVHVKLNLTVLRRSIYHATRLTDYVQSNGPGRRSWILLG